MQGASLENAPSADAPLLVDRYAIYDAIASGGMATVHLGRLIGNAGFLRTVAIKRLHSQFAHDPDFTAMFLDEARLASRIQHPNVVSTLDVVIKDRELLLVMEYVRGESLARLVRRARDRDERIPPRVVVAILAGALNGLHAAHEAVDEKGVPLGLVHRDMSPQNILVGTDGVARVLDFGVAKAAGRVHTTRDGDIKGKVLYMAPEQLAAQPLTRTADVYGVGVVLFETLTCVRMFAGENEVAAITKIIQNEIRLPSEIAPELAPFDAVVRHATAANAAHRYPTAQHMAIAIEATGITPASAAEVSAWVHRLAGETLDERARIVAEIERSSTRSKPPLPVPNSGVIRVPMAAAMAQRPDANANTAVQAVVIPPPAARRPIAIVSIVLLIALLGGALAVIAVLLARGGSGTPASAAARPAESAQLVQAVQPGAVATVPPAPVEEAAVVATAAVVKRPEAPAPSPSPSPSTTASAVRKFAPSPGGGGRPHCDPPYVIDKNGHQHFLPECMK
jgi:serine/threonine protein kinase